MGVENFNSPAPTIKTKRTIYSITIITTIYGGRARATQLSVIRLGGRLPMRGRSPRRNSWWAAERLATNPCPLRPPRHSQVPVRRRFRRTARACARVCARMCTSSCECVRACVRTSAPAVRRWPFVVAASNSRVSLVPALARCYSANVPVARQVPARSWRRRFIRFIGKSREN